MKTKIKSVSALLLASLVAAGMALAQDSDPPAPPPDKPENTPKGPPENVGGGSSNRPTDRPHMVNENASDTAKAVHEVIRQFDERRNAIMAERKALIERLRAAETEEERQAIIEELRTERKAQADERRALGKEIREELRRLREARNSGDSG